MIGDGDADLGVGGDHAGLERADVRPALEQLRWHAHGNLGRGQERIERDRARDWLRRPAEQDADLVLGEGDVALDLRDGGGGLRLRGLGPKDRQLRFDAATDAILERAQRLAEQIAIAHGDGLLMIEPQQREVVLRDIAHEREQNRAAIGLLGENARESGFIGPANAAPEIEFPEGIEREAAGVAGLIAVELGALGEVIVAAAAGMRAVADLGKQTRSRLGPHAPSLLDARDGDAHIVILREGLVDQSHERRIAEHLPPGEVGDGGGLRVGPPAPSRNDSGDAMAGR